MRYDSHEISDDLGQPSCTNAPNNKMAARRTHFHDPRRVGGRVSTASPRATALQCLHACWQRLSPILGSRRGNLGGNKLLASQILKGRPWLAQSVGALPHEIDR